jgi:hypothetical protein
MKKTMYGTYKISELRFNCCYGDLCNVEQRRKCDKNKNCNLYLTEKEECGIAGFSFLKVLTDRERDLKFTRVDKWRKENYKMCKPILMTINRG